MGFREHLSEICDGLPGCLGATVMGFDGIPIDIYEPDGGEALAERGMDLSSLFIELANGLSGLRQAADNLHGGDLGEVSVETSGIVAQFRLLTDDYFVALGMWSASRAPQGVHPLEGKGRYLLRRHAAALVEELEG